MSSISSESAVALTAHQWSPPQRVLSAWSEPRFASTAAPRQQQPQLQRMNPTQLLLTVIEKLSSFDELTMSASSWRVSSGKQPMQVAKLIALLMACIKCTAFCSLFPRALRLSYRSIWALRGLPFLAKLIAR